MLYRLMCVFAGMMMTMSGYALDSDRDQVATLNADDFELDLSSGVRIYRGNVVFRQGSIVLQCDELVTHLNGDGALDKGVCVGSPGRFKQRPEGAKEDIVGLARQITMDNIAETVVLKSQAKVTQGGSQISGRLITYDLVTEKVTVKGGSQSASNGQSASNDDTAAEQSDKKENSRPSLVIQPRNKTKE